jgi:hypothetical protein
LQKRHEIARVALNGIECNPMMKIAEKMHPRMN